MHLNFIHKQSTLHLHPENVPQVITLAGVSIQKTIIASTCTSFNLWLNLMLYMFVCTENTCNNSLNETCIFDIFKD